MITLQPLKAPFPYFGGKAKVAGEIWRRFGDAPNFVEPFFGSGAVLLARPSPPRLETVNDKDCLLANFWRAVQHDPEQVAYYADWPVNEADLHARHAWLHRQRADVERLMSDPEWYDAKIAGWWVWGISCWIGSGWCDPKALKKSGQSWQARPQLTHEQGVVAVQEKRPHLMNAGRGVHRARLSVSQRIPHLSDAGTGDARPCPPQQLPHLSSTGQGVPSGRLAPTGGIYALMESLSVRLRRVRVCCGDWSRITSPAVTEKNGLTAVFLDPPYSHDERDVLYAEDHDIAADVRAWALARGDNPLYRICLAGYTEEHDAHIPASWERLYWKTTGGYGNQGEGRGRENAGRECLWFSPHCLRGETQPTLFDYIDDESEAAS